MIKLSEKACFASNNEIIAEEHFTGEIKKEKALLPGLFSSHNTSGNMDKLKIKFDSLASHDITLLVLYRPQSVRYGTFPAAVCADQPP